jgi:hypothetical protein
LSYLPSAQKVTILFLRFPLTNFIAFIDHLNDENEIKQPSESSDRLSPEVDCFFSTLSALLFSSEG